MTHELDGTIVIEIFLVKPSPGVEARICEVLVGVGREEPQEGHLDHSSGLVCDLWAEALSDSFINAIHYTNTLVRNEVRGWIDGTK